MAEDELPRAVPGEGGPGERAAGALTSAGPQLNLGPPSNEPNQAATTQLVAPDGSIAMDT